MKHSVIILFSFLLCASGFAQLKPNSLFTDNMILQHGVSVPVWGTANDGESITVEFEGQKVIATVTNGKWLAKLKPLKEVAPSL